MGLVSSLLERRNRFEMPLSELDRLMDQAVSGQATATGRDLSTVGALNCIAVYDAVRILAEDVSALPLVLYRRLEAGGKDRASEHPLYRILHNQPNPEMTSLELRQAIVGHMALWGNAYANVVRDYGGRVLQLWPLRPDRMRVFRDSPGVLRYLYRLQDGSERALRMEEICHFRLYSLDGVMGLSPVGQAREGVALAMGIEEYGGRFFGNGSRPGGVLRHPGTLKPESKVRLKADWEAAHRGLVNSHRVAILEEGMEWQTIGIPPQDAQYLETRKFQITEIARIFRLPPHMLGDLERATFSNIEHQSLDYVVHTLMPWLSNVEQRIWVDIIPESDKATLFAEHLVDGLLRGDILSRYQAYAVARTNGWMSADDIRERENMNPLPEGQGKIYLVPLNMVPADQIGQQSPPELPYDEDNRALPEPAMRAANRRRIAASWRRLFSQAASRVIKRETQDVGHLAEKWLTKRDAGQFELDLADFYRKHPEFVERAFLAVLLTYADEINADAAAEVGAEAGMTPELEQFMREYVENLARDWCYSSEGQIREIVRSAQADGRDAMEALSARFAEWTETRADKLALQHTVKAAGAVSVFTWKRVGVRRIKWVAHGQNCPFCSALNGRVIGIDEVYLARETDFKPDGVEKTLRPSRNIGHAPLHGGCDCGLSAVRGM